MAGQKITREIQLLVWPYRCFVNIITDHFLSTFSMEISADFIKLQARI